MRIIQTVTAEGFTSSMTEDDNGRVWFKADADIDADGANGQNGAIAAYRSDNKGSEHLANGGMTIRDGRVVGAESWFRDIVIVGPDGNPLVLPSGVIISKTAYQFPNTKATDPAAWVDSETVPYIVVPPSIISAVTGVVKGCAARATYKGKVVDAIVADVGPRTKNGELSIALARALGIPSSPRTGGISTADVLYELWPGVHGKINGKEIPLMKSNGGYIFPASTPLPPVLGPTMQLRWLGTTLQQLWQDAAGQNQQWKDIPTAPSV